jgi:hypothetical protein
MNSKQIVFWKQGVKKQYKTWHGIDNIYRQAHPVISNWLREEDFLEINQSETRIVCGGHVC